MEQVIVTWLTEIILPTFATALMAVAFGLAREWARKIKDERIREIILELVRAAEQQFGRDQGAEKKRYVARELTARGLEADSPRIEAAVNREFGKLDVAPDAEGE